MRCLPSTKALPIFNVTREYYVAVENYSQAFLTIRDEYVIGHIHP